MSAGHGNTKIGRFGLVTITVGATGPPPFDLDAVVVEQDTDLLMDADTPVSDPHAGYPRLAREAARDPGRQPGRVLVRRGTTPLRLWAVVHDLDRRPSCRPEWIAQALLQVLIQARRRSARNLCVPALGCACGAVDVTRLLELLAAALREAAVVRELRVWMPVAPGMLAEARDALQHLDF